MVIEVCRWLWVVMHGYARLWVVIRGYRGLYIVMGGYTRVMGVIHG